MARSRELKVVIAGDSDKLNRSLKSAGKGLERLGKDTTMFARVSSRGFSGVGLAAKGLTAAVGGTAAGIGFLVKQAMQAEKVTKQTGAVIKSTGGIANVTAADVDKLATALSRKTGIDDEAIASGENLLLTFTNIRNEAGKGNDIFDQTTTAAVDMAAAMKNAGKEMSISDAALQLGKALNDPEKGMTRLTRVGVSFTEQQKKQVEALMASGKTLDAQRVILRELNKEFGGSAEATAQPLEKLRTETENVGESIGRIFKPAVDAGASSITDFLIEAQEGGGILGRLKTAATAAGGELARVFNRKDLDLGEKLKLSAGVLRRNFAPIAREAGRAIEDAKIPAKLSAMFEKAAPRVIDALAASAPRAASAFVRAFQASGTWGKLLTAAFVINRLGGFSAAGNWAASALANRFKKEMARRAAFSAAGTAAGEVAATSVASGFTARSKGFHAMGKKAGTRVGKGLVAGILLAIPLMVWEFKDQINSLGDWFSSTKIGRVLSAPGRLGDRLGNLLGRIVGTNRAEGGIIPGQGNEDTVPAMLTPGEFVIRKKVVEKFGPTFFAAINDGKAPQMRTSGGIISRANKLDRMQIPYLYGGGHGTRDGFNRGGMDCSASVSYALGISPRVSGALMGFGRPGPGSPNDTKIYANPSHVFAVFNGRGWGTSRENPGGGPGWLSYNHRPGFTIRHLEDGSAKGGSREGVGAIGDPQETAESGKQRKIAREERAGSRLFNKIAKPFSKGYTSAVRVASSLGTTIEDTDTSYDQTERAFGQTEEDLGTATGRAQRVSELTELAKLKAKTLERQRKRAAALEKAIRNRESLLKKLRRARDRAKGSKRAKLNERMRPVVDRLDDLKAELKALGFAIRDTELDIGDLAKEAGEVAATPDAEADPGPTASDKLSQALGDIDLQERAGLLTPEQAQAARIGTLNAALAGGFGALGQREIWDVMGQLREAQQQAAQEMANLAAVIAENTASNKALLAYADRVSAITSLEAVRALSDVMSGQLGARVGARQSMPGSGSLSRF